MSPLPLPLPLALPTQLKSATHTLTRRSIGTSLSQGLITIVIVLFLVTLLFFFLRRNARRQSEERKVLKLAHLRGTGTGGGVGGEGQVRGSEDTLVEGRGERGGNGEVRMEMGMVPMGLTGMRPTVDAGGRGEMAPPPAYEASMGGMSMAAGPVMPAAYLPDR